MENSNFMTQIKKFIPFQKGQKNPLTVVVTVAMSHDGLCKHSGGLSDGTKLVYLGKESKNSECPVGIEFNNKFWKN
jgi:hypothetical protein